MGFINEYMHDNYPESSGLDSQEIKKDSVEQSKQEKLESATEQLTDIMTEALSSVQCTPNYIDRIYDLVWEMKIEQIGNEFLDNDITAYDLEVL